jgi:signal transduction histidine kinase
MKREKTRIPIRLKLFLPVTMIIIIVISLLTVWFINTSINRFNEHIKNTLVLEVNTITKMFERESMLKLEKVQTNLKVANLQFYKQPLFISSDTLHRIIENQESKIRHKAVLNKWYLNDILLNESTAFVDSLEKIIGGTITVFQKIDSGFVRITTSIRRPDGNRASCTFIPKHSPVALSILAGETYYGRAEVIDEWYTTAYEPITIDGEVKGMLYVGDKEKDMAELKRVLKTLKIGKSGYVFVFDKNGKMLIHPYLEGEDWADRELFKEIKESGNGIIEYVYKNTHKTVAYNYFDKFELYVGASINDKAESRQFTTGAVIGATIVGLLSILFLLFFIYRFTSEKLYRYFSALQESRKKLADTEIALRHSEKLAGMGQIAAGVAHELNNPLGVITMYSNILLEELSVDDPKRKDLELIVEQADRCKNIVGGLLNFARKNKIHPENTDIIELIKASIKSVVIPGNIKVTTNFNIEHKHLMIDRGQMLQVITNLIKNASEAISEKGQISIDISQKDENVLISIEDNGNGIKDEHMDKLFTPFFTTKDIGKGTGLGLSLVYGIIKMHNGKISATSNADPKAGPTGTEFKIILPLNHNKTTES